MHQLSYHYELRDISSDPQGEIVLGNLNSRGTKTRLNYGVEVESLTEVFCSRLEIENYPEADVNLQVWRLPEYCEQYRTDPTTACGILVKGRRAIYDNTLFNQAGKPHAGWFCGRLTSRYIDQLSNEYDDRQANGEPHPPTNHMPIIRRHMVGRRMGPDLGAGVCEELMQS